MQELALKQIVKKIEVSFQSQKLTLLPAKPEHAPAVVEALKETLDSLQAYLPWALDPSNVTLDGQVRRLAKTQFDFFHGNDYVFHLFNEAFTLLGTFTLHKRNLNPRGLELGYWLRASAMGQGLATLASQVLTVFAFEVLGCERLQCGYNENNTASGKVSKKLGFIEEGRLAYFEAKPSSAPKMGRHTVLGRLLPEEARAQPWYPSVKNSCEFTFLFPLVIQSASEESCPAHAAPL